METYRIRGWGQHFENNRTRELKELRFVILPNKHDGDGYTELVDHPDGAAHYGAWVAIVQVASKCDPRGTLLRDGDRAHDSTSLARLTRLPKDVFDQALPRLFSIGWLEYADPQSTTQALPAHIDSAIPHDTATITAESRTPLRKSDTEWKGIEENRIEEKEELTLVAQARQVFTFWKQHLEHPKSIFDNKRERAITARIKSGFTVEQLETAIRGCKLTPFNMGDNDRHQKYDDLDVICQSAKNVERFIATAEGTNGIHTTSQFPRNQTANERRAASFGRLVAITEELRSESERATNENVRRKSLSS